ncbi:MAG TPA: hypothetical protein VFX16_25080 [Pseudonocardiaceae bacterium]|nr:hypothetical protein [Pseudonocardiaceae bacterium]
MVSTHVRAACQRELLAALSIGRRHIWWSLVGARRIRLVDHRLAT